MESSEHFSGAQNKIKKKLIPWHCQQRYQTSLSQISFNHTLNKATYIRKIKSLLNNNRNLAKALERSRYELSDKENIQQNNAKNIDIINFSSLKLKEISDNLKKVTSCVDETFTVLRSYIGTNPPKNLFCPSMTRSNFKKRFQAVSNINLERLDEEIDENLENEQSLEGNKDPVWSIKQTITNKAKSKEKKVIPANPTNKKDKLTVKKSKNQFLKTQNGISSQKVTVRTSKPHVDDTPPSYLLGISSDSESFKNLIELSKKASKCKSSKKNAMSKRNPEQKHGLGPCPKSVISNSEDQQKEMDKGSKFIKNSKDKPKKVTGDKAESNSNESAPCKKAKMTTDQFGPEKSQKCSKDSLSSIDEKSIDSIEKSPSSSLETNLKALTITNTTSCQPIGPNTKTHNTSASIVQTDSHAIATLGNLRVVLERKGFMQKLNSVEKPTVSLNEIFDESDQLSQTSLPLKSSLKTTNSCQKKVGFLLEEDSNIEMLSETQQPIIKTKKTSKRPLKESTQNVSFLPCNKKARSTSSEAMEFKKKNTFIVTAEVHQPPDGYTPKKRPTIDDIHLLNMQPSVILTDIFKSKLKKNSIVEKVYPPNQMEECLLTQMVRKEDTEAVKLENSSCDWDFQANHNKENKIDAQNFLETRKQSRRRSKVSSYKEVKLNVKMRRC